jgi:hypothetical protein
VWLEPVSPDRIDDLRITPDAEASALEIVVYLHAPGTGWDLDIEALDGATVVARAQTHTPGAVARLWLEIPGAKRWSPDSPHLYDLRLRLRRGQTVLDEVTSYAGVRSVAVRDGYLQVNGEPTYLAMVLDQGYWPESYLAAPSDQALRADVEWVKRFGFNGARKHQKIEDPRWLYWCDRLGLLVWGEMPNARAWNTGSEESLLAEWERAVERDYNHPCVVTWVPVNESMGFPGLREDHPGQYAFIERTVALTRRLDPYRPVIDNDGWEHTDVTDICAIHDYTPTAEKLRERYAQTLRGGPLPERIWTGSHRIFALGSRYRGQPIMLTEAGGFLTIPLGVPVEERDWLYSLYGTSRTGEELLAKYRDLMSGIAELPFISGFCYTQLTDIEHEMNGLLTYDRRPKTDVAQIAAANRRLVNQRRRATFAAPPP